MYKQKSAIYIQWNIIWHKRNEVLMHAITRVNSENTILKYKNKITIVIYYMSLFILNVQNSQNQRPKIY